MIYILLDHHNLHENKGHRPLVNLILASYLIHQRRPNAKASSSVRILVGLQCVYIYENS